MSLKVLGIGDNVADHYLHSNIIYPGGNAFNFAVYASMLGADAAYLGIFGDDFPGRHVYKTAQELGLDLARCRILPGENGCPKVRIEGGDRIFVRSNKGGISRLDPLRLDTDDRAYISGFDLMHTSIYSYLEPNLPAMRDTGVPISFDFSNSATEDYFRAQCPYVTFAVVSAGHLSVDDTQSLIERLHAYGTRYVIATRGEQGSHFSDRNRVYHHPAYMVEARDTLGAGDSYLTAFLLHFFDWLKAGKTGSGATMDYDKMVDEAMPEGSRFAARNCMMDGAFDHGIVYAGYEEPS